MGSFVRSRTCVDLLRSAAEKPGRRYGLLCCRFARRWSPTGHVSSDVVSKSRKNIGLKELWDSRPEVQTLACSSCSV